jgi:hypothetical protein
VSGVTIFELQLVDIPSSSTKPRIFHLHLCLTDPLLIGTSVVPLRLDELEVLYFKPVEQGYFKSLLRWLAPGVKPLELAISHHPGEIKDFCLRSNVTQLYVAFHHTHSLFHCPI